MATRFPLVRAGEGWREVLDPDPEIEYKAYRVVCEDPDCEFAWPGTVGSHSHIEAL